MKDFKIELIDWDGNTFDWTVPVYDWAVIGDDWKDCEIDWDVADIAETYKRNTEQNCTLKKKKHDY